MSQKLTTGACSFESGQCGWKDVSSGRYNWHIFQGSSPGTGGPKTDHTDGNSTGHYMLVEGASGVFFSRARMETPMLGATGPSCQLMFWYHMYGFGAGKATVFCKLELKYLNLNTWEQIEV